MNKIKLRYIKFLDKFGSKLLAKAALMREENVEDIIETDIKGIWKHKDVMDKYLDKVADGDEKLRIILENSKDTVLRESAVSGITPLSYLSFEVGASIWKNFTLKDMFIVEPAKTPRFTVAYTDPYLFKVESDGKTTKFKMNETPEEEGLSVGFDINRKDVSIPTGEFLNSPLPIEFSNDMDEMYDPDGRKELAYITGKIASQKLNFEVLEFLEHEIAKHDLPVSEFSVSDYSDPENAFDLILEHNLTKIKNDTYLQSGTFVLAINSKDVKFILPKIYQSDKDKYVTEYSLKSGRELKIIVEEDLFPGLCYLTYLPSSTSQMTYKYYPYSINLEYNYLADNYPAMMVSRRHSFASFVPALAKIEIRNHLTMDEALEKIKN